MTEAKAFYTVAEVAELLDRPLRTVQRWVREGELFPNAKRLNPEASRSPYLIPAADVEAVRSEFEKLALAAEAEK